MGHQSDMFLPSPKSESESSEALLGKKFSEADTESIDYMPQMQIRQRPKRRRPFWIVLNFALLNIAALLAIYFSLTHKQYRFSPPSDGMFPPGI